MHMYNYNARITRVVDGDTVYADVDLGFHTKMNLAFRLKGIDTPEIFRPVNEAEKAHGMEAKEFLIDLIMDKNVHIKSYKTGKYGRWIADIFIDGVDITVKLYEEGYSKKEKY